MDNTNPMGFPTAPGSGTAGVTRIIAGTNITVSPTGGTGNVTISASGGGSGTPGGTSGQVQYNNAGAFGGFTVGGDATLNTATGALTVTKTNGTAFAASATTDTTNASNIGSGTLSNSRLASSVVTSVTGLSPLFSAAISGQTLGFTLSTAAAYSWFGNATNATAAPAYNTTAIPASLMPFTVSNSTSGYVAVYTGTSTIGGTAQITAAQMLALANSYIYVGNSSNQPAAVAMSGDATISNTGAITVTKTNGTAFAASATTDTTNASNISTGTIGAARLPVFTSTANGAAPASGGGTTNYLRADGTWAAPAGGGTVTSVGLSLPSFITVSGSPVTGSGTLTGTLASQSANLFFASPNGSTGTPSFRAMVAADLPTTTANSIGNLSPLFTSSISGQAISFTLSNAAGYSWFGNASSTSGAPSFNTTTIPTAMLPVFSGSSAGLVPSSAGGTTNFLRADGTWQAPSGGGGGGGMSDGGAKTASFTAAVNTTYSITATGVVCTLPAPAAGEIVVYVASGGGVTFNTTSGSIYGAVAHASGSLSDSTAGDVWRFTCINSQWVVQMIPGF